MKDWQEYESQIFELLKLKFPNSNIDFNQKIEGLFSKRKRQIDILVSEKVLNKDIRIVIDCKKFSKKIDVKAVESFIGFSEDCCAHIGIMITNEGYTESAKKRVENYHRDIQLEIVDFEDFEIFIENFKYCTTCELENKTSLVYWNFSNPIIIDEIINLIDIGNCKVCNQKYIRCQVCGTYLEIKKDQCFCLCEEKKYFVLNENKEIVVSLSKFNFENPNQLKLF